MDNHSNPESAILSKGGWTRQEQGSCPGGLYRRYAGPMTDDRPAGTLALDALERATELAENAVTGATDGREAFRCATELADAFREAAERVRQLRGQAARRTRDQEALTLRALADRIGVSKSRADQLVKEASSHG